jgi:hypothetical protein
MLPVVADSWPKLRGCDVHRLLSKFSDDLEKAGNVILDHRPDLAQQVCDAANDLAENT